MASPGVRSIWARLRKSSPAPLPPQASSAPASTTLQGVADEWEGSIEKELSAVVRQLPKDDPSNKLECPICLSKCPRQRAGWVVFPCNHGVCSRCFQHMIDTQARKCSCPLCRMVLLEPTTCAGGAVPCEPATADASSQLERAATGSSDVSASGELAGPLDETTAAEPAAHPSVVTEAVTGTGIWWLRGSRRRQRPVGDTVAYVTGGVPGQQGVWARMGSSVIWLPSIKRTSEGAAQDGACSQPPRGATNVAPIFHNTLAHTSNSSMPSVWYPTL